MGNREDKKGGGMVAAQRGEKESRHRHKAVALIRSSKQVGRTIITLAILKMVDV